MADQLESGGGDDAKASSRAAGAAADREAFLGFNGKDDDAKRSDKGTRDLADDEETDELEVDDDADDDVDLDEDSDEDDSDDDDSESDDEESDDEDDDSKEKPDADTAKRLQAVRRREQRSREQLANERKAFEKERDQLVSEWKPRVAAAEKFEALKARGVNAYNALDVLRELGLAESDYESTAQAIYAMSEKGKADPRHAAAIERAKKERARDEEIAEVKKKLAEREEADQKKAEANEQMQKVNAYLDGLVKAAPAGTLAAYDIAKKPDKTRHRLGRIATKITEKTGTLASPKKVIAAYEKIRTKELRELDIDPSKFKKTEAAKAPVKKGDKKTAQSTTEDDDDNSKPLTRSEFIAASKKLG